MAQQLHNIFVYGSLKQGNDIRGMQHFGDAEFVGPARTKKANFLMVDMGSFPGVMNSTEEQKGFKIVGEVYTVNDETLEWLDQIEGVPFFYNRYKVSTTLGDAWMYMLPNAGEYDDSSKDHTQSDLIMVTGDKLIWKE
jgi:gamma-glutamylcyclotransferase (GGCT)/AIG2-like uncharacterized protein YtfP